jgi:hypothetical protein
VTDETLSILIHTDSKVGKTTFAASGPRPILALDAEGGWKFIPLRKVYWDPLTYAPPVWDGSWDVCIVKVRDWGTVQSTYQWLNTGQHPFETIVMDSITEIQKRCKANLVTTDQPMQIQHWGRLLDMMDSTIHGFRDLTQHPTRPVRVVIFIAETREINGKWQPYMQGQISISLPYWMDIVGYLYKEMTADSNGQLTQTQRKLLVSSHPQYLAGERVQGRLGSAFTVTENAPETVSNDIERILQLVYPKPQG